MSEIRLIDANALPFLKLEIESEEGHGIEMCIKAVEDAPTIPTQPVKRGKWETKGGVHCTRCGWRPTGRICDLFTAYCAGCGAKMDGGDAK